MLNGTEDKPKYFTLVLTLSLLARPGPLPCQTGASPFPCGQPEAAQIAREAGPNPAASHPASAITPQSTVSSALTTTTAAGLSPYLAGLATKLSFELGDARHTTSNRTQTANLFRVSGLTQKEFARLLYQARDLTCRYAVPRAGEALPPKEGVRNLMAYFFTVVRDLVARQCAGRSLEEALPKKLEVVPNYGASPSFKPETGGATRPFRGARPAGSGRSSGKKVTSSPVGRSSWGPGCGQCRLLSLVVCKVKSKGIKENDEIRPLLTTKTKAQEVAPPTFSSWERRITSRMRKLHVTFDEIIYDPTKPAERERLVRDLMWKAYGLWLSSEQIVNQLRVTIRAVYALRDSGPLADAEHNMVYPMVGFEKGFEAALADCQQDIGKRLDWSDPAILEACKSYWEVGKDYYEDFVRKYRHYFEAAVAANLYAPNYAFNQACMAAGLPLEEWVDQFGLSELGYYEVDD